LVIGLSAGLLAPVIGLGLGAALGTVGLTGTTTFLTGAGGAALITTGGVLSGSSIAGRGMAKRTRQVKTFSLLPIHNNKRVNCIIAVPGCVLNSFPLSAGHLLACCPVIWPTIKTILGYLSVSLTLS
jgi:hypothetical protein